jgi:hypothetical protein
LSEVDSFYKKVTELDAGRRALRHTGRRRTLGSALEVFVRDTDVTDEKGGTTTRGVRASE